MKRSLLLVVIIATTANYNIGIQDEKPKNQPYSYSQDFRSSNAPTIGKVVPYPLHFDDVGENNRLSSWWPNSSWRISENGVSVVNSRVYQVHNRKLQIYNEFYDNPPIQIMRGFRMPWLTLYMGDEDWTDYTVETTITPDSKENNGEFTTAGVAFRFHNARQYYAFFLTKTGTGKLVFRSEDREFEEDHPAWDVIGEEPLQVKPGQTYKVRITVDGDKLTCYVDNKTVIEARDTRLSYGKVALLADNPANFGPVNVRGVLIRKQLPPLPKIATPKLVHATPIPEFKGGGNYDYIDLDGDREFEILINYSTENKGFTYQALKLDGTVLWELTGLDLNRTHALCDINGNGRNDLIVTTIAGKIQIRDGANGHLFFEIPMPEAINYLGDRKLPRSSDAQFDYIIPIRINRNRPYGFIIKDRYWNIWAYDRFGNQIWHRSLSTGHKPLVVDVNGDGVDEIVASNTLLDARDGRIIWDLGLEDHADDIQYFSLEPGIQPNRIYISHGEAGLLIVDPLSGDILFRGHLGHVQRHGIGNFVKDMPGKQLIIHLRWREDNIHYLYDKDMKKIATWVMPPRPVSGYSFPYAVTPIGWGMNGHDLLIDYSGDILDPLSGRLVMKSLGNFDKMLDDTPWGNQVMVIVDNIKNEIRFYARD